MGESHVVNYVVLDGYTPRQIGNYQLKAQFLLNFVSGVGKTQLKRYELALKNIPSIESKLPLITESSSCSFLIILIRPSRRRLIITEYQKEFEMMQRVERKTLHKYFFFITGSGRWKVSKGQKQSNKYDVYGFTESELYFHNPPLL